MATLVRANANMTAPAENNTFAELAKELLLKWYDVMINQSVVISGKMPNIMMISSIPLESAICLIGEHYVNPDADMFDDSIYIMIRTAVLTSSSCVVKHILNQQGVHRPDNRIISPIMELAANRFFEDGTHLTDNILDKWVKRVIQVDLEQDPTDFLTRNSFSPISDDWFIERFVTLFVSQYSQHISDPWVEVFEECRSHPTDLNFLTEYSMPEFVHDDKELEMFRRLFGVPIILSLTGYVIRVLTNAGFSDEFFSLLPFGLSQYGVPYLRESEDGIIKYRIRYNKVVKVGNSGDRSDDTINVAFIANEITRRCCLELKLTDIMVLLACGLKPERRKEFEDILSDVYAIIKPYTWEMIDFMAEVATKHQILAKNTAKD